MRGKDFGDKTGLDSHHVDAAEKANKKKKGNWVKYAALAACLCVLVGGIYVGAHIISGKSQPNISNDTNPDAITIPELKPDGTGFEGYMVYDVSELTGGNPWSENMGITELPVYINGSYDTSGAGVPKGLSEEEIAERLKRFASAFELEIGTIEVVKDGLGTYNGEVVKAPAPTWARAETPDYELTAYADGSVEYHVLGEGSVLPETLNFTYSETTDEEAEAVLSYFIDSYDMLQQYGEPIGTSFGDYTAYGDLMRNYVIYDGAGDDVAKILNFNFRQSRFIPNAKGNLSTIRINDGLLTAQKIRDYPIISTEEATDRLIRGNYQTSAPAMFPGKEFIGRVELIYRTGRLEEVFLPYYRFYVLMPDDASSESASEKRLKTYGAYYVPALHDEDIVNMPTYDGRFN